MLPRAWRSALGAASRWNAQCRGNRIMPGFAIEFGKPWRLSWIAAWMLPHDLSVIGCKNRWRLLVYRGFSTSGLDPSWRSARREIEEAIAVIKQRRKWDEMRARIRELETQLERGVCWQDEQQVQQFHAMTKEKGRLEAVCDSVAELESQLEECVLLIELGQEGGEEGDLRMAEEGVRRLAALRDAASNQKMEAVLTGPFDHRSCFLEIQAGAGGTESCDWAAMLQRMYAMWAARRRFQVTTAEEVAGEEAGIKRATLKIEGANAFGLLRSEVGVHRLVRISPFDAAKRRHTSFAAVAIMPVFEEEDLSDIKLDMTQVRIDIYRSSGCGGQHANTTDSAVRVTHLPTGIVCTCQNERSQHQNKAFALNMLKSRLMEIKLKERSEKAAEFTAGLSDNKWGAQIRSYVLQQVKDLRTGYTSTSPSSVLDGELDPFINSYLASTTS
eukprot:jgi/Mesvir1/27026/Mv20728-RA.1